MRKKNQVANANDNNIVVKNAVGVRAVVPGQEIFRHLRFIAESRASRWGQHQRRYSAMYRGRRLHRSLSVCLILNHFFFFHLIFPGKNPSTA